nr:hypothetical protein [Tanacetum cinerariifolium]
SRSLQFCLGPQRGGCPTLDSPGVHRLRDAGRSGRERTAGLWPERARQRPLPLRTRRRLRPLPWHRLSRPDRHRRIAAPGRRNSPDDRRAQTHLPDQAVRLRPWPARLGTGTGARWPDHAGGDQSCHFHFRRLHRRPPIDRHPGAGHAATVTHRARQGPRPVECSVVQPLQPFRADSLERAHHHAGRAARLRQRVFRRHLWQIGRSVDAQSVARKRRAVAHRGRLARGLAQPSARHRQNTRLAPGVGATLRDDGVQPLSQKLRRS